MELETNKSKDLKNNPIYKMVEEQPIILNAMKTNDFSECEKRGIKFHTFDNRIKELHIGKSFVFHGKSLNNCYNCSFCRAKNEEKQERLIIPSKINPNFNNIPVAVNIFYGDPIKQLFDTQKYIDELIKNDHIGPIILITKGDISLLDVKYFQLPNLFIFLSTFGVDNFGNDKNVESGKSMESFEDNIETALDFIKKGCKCKFGIEFRPICYGINDKEETIKEIFEIASQDYNYTFPIGYSGLQGKPDTVKYWKENNIDLKPYPGYNFGHKKMLSDEVENFIKKCSKHYNVPIFRKTSCMISWLNNQPDYNAHYYRPTEVGCSECYNKYMCENIKNYNDTLDNNHQDVIEIKDIIPFKFELVKKVNHKCILLTKGICEFPTADCSKISGNIIKIEDKLTTADVRVIKWLTGFTVDADFEESSELSNNWRI
jgi:hypothetical protein